MQTDFNSLVAKCKKLGYKLSKIEPDEYKLQPYKRGFVLYFHNRADLLAWLKQEIDNKSNDFYLMEYGK